MKGGSSPRPRKRAKPQPDGESGPPPAWAGILQQCTFEAAAYRSAARRLRPLLNTGLLSGFGIGLISPAEGDELGVLVYVENDETVSRVSGIPERLKVQNTTMRVSVQVAGPGLLMSGEGLNRARQSAPYRGGASIEDAVVADGGSTYGVKVLDVARRPPADAMLTAAHSLSSGPIRTPVIHPGSQDGGSPPNDIVASKERRLLGNFTSRGPTGTFNTYVDAGIATDVTLDRDILHLGPVQGLLSPWVVAGLPIAKSGRGTGVTTAGSSRLMLRLPSSKRDSAGGR